MLRLTNWLNRLAKFSQAVICLLISLDLTAQQLPSFSLSEAYQAAEANFPLLKEKSIFAETEMLSIKNINASLLPQFTLSGQASYQSSVTAVEIPLPTASKEFAQSKDQYRIVGDLSQVIYDGGYVNAQRELQRLNTAMEESRLEIDIYQVKSKISQLYFNILYQDALLRQTELLIKDIEIGMDKVRPQVEEAVVLRSNLLVLEVQLLQNRQKVIEISSVRQGLTDALSVLTNAPLGANTVFSMPPAIHAVDTGIYRPELKFFEQQTRLAEGQLKMIDSKLKPRVNVFLQGGYGRPALNMLANKFEPYYVAGLRFNWSLGNFYNKEREKQLVEMKNKSVHLQEENFLLNTKSQLKQLAAEISKFKKLVASDQQIIELRNRITETSKLQLENAVITANDYLREINAADIARQSLITHQLQLLQAEINYQLNSGKL